MYYVQVTNGAVVTNPQWLGSDITASPNTSWPQSQMDIWGYVIVDISYNPDLETIDLGNPIVNQDGSVTYTRTPLTQDQIDARNFQKIIDAFNPSSCIAALYTEFSDRATLINQWGALVAWLIQFKNFSGLRLLADSQLSGQDLVDFKAVFSGFGITLDNFPVTTSKSITSDAQVS